MTTTLVTGAGRNIGLAVAGHLAARGHQVALNARSDGAVTTAAADITATGGTAIAVPGDVGDREAVGDIVSQVRSTFGDISVLVHCAAIRVHRDFLAMSYEEWRTPFQVGLDGAFHCAQAVLPGMVLAGWGRIVLVAGISGQAGAAHRAGLVAAKAGMIGLTRALAVEFAGTGVTVNALSPGMIDTERGAWTSQGDQATTTAHYASRSERIPVGRMGRRDEVTAAVDYMISDAAGFFTGQTLNLNGGMFMS